MTLVGTEGLNLLGPGSEWLWSMGQFVVVAVTLIGIYYQLRLARSANSFEQVHRLHEDFESERTARNALEVMLAIKAGGTAGNLPEGPVSYLQDYWENVGSLVRAGHIELRMLEAFGGMCRWWWAALEPNIRRHRVATDNARSGENFEWLAASIATMEARSGPGRVVDADYLSRTLDQAIEREVGRIRVAEQLRAVVTVPPVATQAPSNGAALDRLVDSPA